MACLYSLGFRPRSLAEARLRAGRVLQQAQIQFQRFLAAASTSGELRKGSPKKTIPNLLLAAAKPRSWSEVGSRLIASRNARWLR